MNNPASPLALVSTAPAPTTVAPVTTPRTRRANRPNAQSRNMQQLASVWNSLNGTEQTSWKTLSGSLVATRENGLFNKANAYATFIQYNTMLQGSGNPIARSAPTDDTPPYPIVQAGVTLTANVSGGASAVVIYAVQAYSPSVIVYAAKPLLAGANTYPKSSFKRLGSLSGLTTGANPIGELYLAKYRIPSDGFEIALKLVGVMDSGRCTPELQVTTIVTA